MDSFSYYNQTVVDRIPVSGPASESAWANLDTPPGLPGLLFDEFAVDTTASSPSLKVGPYSSFVNMGYYQNRLNPSTNLIFTLGKHTIVAGGGYSYTQLNIENNRSGIAQITTKNFQTFLEGEATSPTCWRRSTRQCGRTTPTATTAPTRSPATFRTSGRCCRI